MLLYLVRHGETDWNRARRIQGSTDIPLNDTGRRQASDTADILARRRWDAVLSSPLSRAWETASIIADRLGLAAPAPVDALVERSYGEAEGLDGRDLDRLFPDDMPVPGRETREKVGARVLPALLEIAEQNPDRRLIVVSHGGVIRTVLALVDPDGDHGLITNGSVHSFRYEEGAFSLIGFDDPIEDEAEENGGDDVREQNPAELRG